MPSAADDPPKPAGQPESPTPSFRFGLGIGVDTALGVKQPFQSSPLVGVGPALQLRIGAQLTRTLGLFYQGHVAVNGVNAAMLALNSVELEASTGALQVGLGPSVDFVAGVANGIFSGPFIPQSPSSGPFFGLESHVAFVIARSSTIPDRGVAHIEFTLHLHPTFATEGVVLVLSAGFGVDWF
jgi:hypothetical protein